MHQRIGILGGMSPESTVLYYEHITRGYTARFGDYGYPEVLIYSVNFQQFVDWQHRGEWAQAARAMAAALNGLHRAGASFGLIATNTMHIVFDEVQAEVAMPLISIVDATAGAIREARLGCVGLLGTVFTMRERFFIDGLRRSGIDALVPDTAAQDHMNHIIYNELCRGEIRPESRQLFQQVIEKLQMQGARGIILGCTEIPLLVRPEDSPLPLFNTSTIHAESALRRAIGS